VPPFVEHFGTATPLPIFKPGPVTPQFSNQIDVVAHIHVILGHIEGIDYMVQQWLVIFI